MLAKATAVGSPVTIYVLIHLKASYRARDNELFHLLVFSIDGHNGQAKSGTRRFCRVSHTGHGSKLPCQGQQQGARLRAEQPGLKPAPLWVPP